MKQENKDDFRKVTEPFAEFMGALFEMNSKKKMEVKNMQTIKKIIVEAGEECNIDVDVLHETLSKLPAEMYLDLFKKMQMKIYGYPAFSGWGGGCAGTLEDKTE